MPSEEIIIKSERRKENRYLKSERGSSLVEYALLISLIAVCCLAGMKTLGIGAELKLEDFQDQMASSSDVWN